MAALDGQYYVRAQTELERLNAALVALALGSLNGTSGLSRRKRGHVSAATRERMAAAQRARWFKQRRDTPAASKAPIPIRAKRRLSAAGLASIRAAQKSRWAKWKKEQKAAA